MRRYTHMFFSLALLFDAVMVAAAWLLAYVIRFRLGLFSYIEPALPGLAPFAVLLPVVVTCNLFAVGLTGLYRPPRSQEWIRNAMQILKTAALGWLALLAVLYYLSSSPYSRKLLVISLFLNPMALLASRFLLRRVFLGLRSAGWGVQRAAVVGTGRLAQSVLTRLQDNPWIPARIDYFIGEESGDRTEVFGVPLRGDFSSLLETMRANPVENVFVAMPARASEKLEEILNTLMLLPVTVVVVPDLTGTVSLNQSVGELGGLPVIQLRDSPICGWPGFAKRVTDVVGSLILLAVFGLPMLILTALVKLTSPGPVLFRQERMSLGGKPFTMLKLRSMHVDAEAETGPVLATRGDPRRTSVGAFLRWTSLDELPQLINVLRGDMSLVGPRPERPWFIQKFQREMPAYMLRHNVKAGLTGWAQVNGYRGNTSFEKRLEYDLYYIDNWSLSFDLFILLLTPFRGLFGKHAY